MNKQTFFLITLVVVSCYHISHAMQEEKEVLQNLQEIVTSNGYEAGIVLMKKACDDPNASFQECIHEFVNAIKTKRTGPPQNDNFKCIIIVETKERSDDKSNLLSQEQQSRLKKHSHTLRLPIIILSSTESEVIVENYDLKTETWETSTEIRFDEPEEDRSLPWCGAWFKERGSFWSSSS